MFTLGTFRSLWRAAWAALAILLMSCAALPPVAASTPPIPPKPGLARVWFYRDYEPYESLSRPYVHMNDQIVGISDPGGAFYRDVPAGRYKLTVDTWGTDVNQFPIIDLRPGEVVFAKVESLSSWASNGGRNPYQRDTFYVRIIPAQLAQAELPSHPLSNGY